MSLSSSEPQQLTFGDGKISPQFEWIVYAARVADKPVLLKMPVAGGAPANSNGITSIVRMGGTHDSEIKDDLRFDPAIARCGCATAEAEAAHG